MGALATWLLRCAPARGAATQLAFGAALVAIVATPFVATAFAVAAVAEHAGALGSAALAVALKPSFALRALGEAAMRVRAPLAAGELATARDALRGLCSRPTHELGADEVIAATVESVAENTCGSFVAPIFYYALLGLPGAVAYRVVNTLDAMVGYRGRFEYLGKPAARLDDLLNLVPARLTALALLAAGPLAGGRARRGVRVWRRDARATASPNAGHPMAAMAPRAPTSSTSARRPRPPARACPRPPSPTSPARCPAAG
jgi:adenosylcobinamide-phosphate synthase